MKRSLERGYPNTTIHEATSKFNGIKITIREVYEVTAKRSQ